MLLWMHLYLLTSPTSVFLYLVNTSILPWLCLHSVGRRQTEHTFVWKSRHITSVRTPTNAAICVLRWRHLNTHLELYDNDRADVDITAWNFIWFHIRVAGYKLCTVRKTNKKSSNNKTNRNTFCLKNLLILLNVFLLNEMQIFTN